MCGSGQGMTIAANKVAGVRAVLPSDKLSAFLTREHNDANVICFGAWTTEPAEATKVLKVWLFSAFAGGVHEKRIEKILRIEEDNSTNSEA
jgi:ribose 5-phosphate isomerase B